MGVGMQTGEIASVPAGSDLWSLLEPYLVGREKLLWVGQPDPRRRFSTADRFLVPFSIFWLAFAIFWEAAAISAGGGLFFVLWGIPFIAIGLYMTVGRFAYKAYRKERTIYGVTDTRVLELYRGRGGESLNAAFIRSLPAINGRFGRDGSGTVFFGSVPQGRQAYSNSGMDFFGTFVPGAAPVVFYDIPDARSVVELVERLRADAS